MSYKVEISPSGRAKCKQCEELIAKGDLRLIIKTYGFHVIVEKYCKKCATGRLNTDIEKLMELKRKLGYL